MRFLLASLFNTDSYTYGARLGEEKFVLRHGSVCLGDAMGQDVEMNVLI